MVNNVAALASAAIAVATVTMMMIAVRRGRMVVTGILLNFVSTNGGHAVACGGQTIAESYLAYL